MGDRGSFIYIVDMTYSAEKPLWWMWTGKIGIEGLIEEVNGSKVETLG
jgi:hypothetical protein